VTRLTVSRKGRPLDPVQITAGAIAGRIATRAINSILGPEADNSLELRSDELQTLEDDGEVIAILTLPQVQDIEKFLESREILSLMQSWSVLKVREDHHPDTWEYLDKIANSFCDLAEQWCADKLDPWSSLAMDIWQKIEYTLASLVPTVKAWSKSSAENSEIFARYTVGAELVRGKKPPAPKFIREIVQLFSSPARITAARSAASDLCLASSQRYSELSLAHAQDDYRLDVEKLYVDRTFLDFESRDPWDASDLLSPDNSIPRIVVIGDPGVGKSTLVRYLVHQISSRPQRNVAPILVQCKDYVGTHWGSSLTEYIVGQISSEWSFNLEEEVLTDLLITGAAYVVFDGVDEVIDKARRRDLIRRIETFGRRFPFVSIVSTSRKVGYARASFHRNLFRVVELEEFSDSQFEEYVYRWFKATGRSAGERDGFLHESDAVADVRSNPLMLSLLCTLYRARGYIPRNRRQVYHECADLLFQRWDAMRHIEQPFDHRQYGQRLMQELARFFYSSQSAQAGIEENQLVKIIAIFFRDTASIDPPEDEIRAKQFLEFCADRAWLLSSKGTNDRGIRLFAFTHRTFMEYFAAEALVRNSGSIESLSSTVIEAFERDASSVLPDVMVQAADDKFERGAEQILTRLLKNEKGLSRHGDKYLSLCLRVVNSSPMSRGISNLLPAEVLNYWISIGKVDNSYESSVAFFELYRDPRSRMIRSMENSARFRNAVCARWACLSLLRANRNFESEWELSLGKFFDEIAEEVKRAQEDPAEKFDIRLLDYLIGTGRLCRQDFRPRLRLVPSLAISVFDTEVGGAVIAALYNMLNSDAPDSIDEEICGWFKETLYRRHLSAFHARVLASVLADEVRFWRQLTSVELTQIQSRDAQVREILLWLCCVVAEADPVRLHPFHQAVDGVVGLGRFCDILASRSRSLGVPEERGGEALSGAVLDLAVNGYGSWLRSWIKGSRLVVKETDTSANMSHLVGNIRDQHILDVK
jgi:hypothetical protein